MRSLGLVLATAAVTLLLPQSEAAAETITLWHSYRGAEKEALNEIIGAFERANPDVDVEVLATPNDAYASKLTTAIPRGNGPDLFIFAHERIGGWADSGIIAPQVGIETASYIPTTVSAVRYKDKLWAHPLAFKSLVLFRNTEIVRDAPSSTDELLAIGEPLADRGIVVLATLYEKLYFHLPWFFGFGATLWNDDGTPGFATEEALASYRFVKDLAARRFVPAEPTGALVTQLFNDGRAAMVISGPWFIGEIAADVSWAASPLPMVSATGRPASPLLTVEAVFVSAESPKPKTAERLARFLASDESAQVRLGAGQPVANKRAWADGSGGAAALAAFRDAAETAIATDSSPRMRTLWEPGDLVLKKLFRRGDSPEAAARAGLRRWSATTRAAPPGKDPLPFVILIIAIVVLGMALGIRWILRLRRRRQLVQTGRAWLWVSPALVAAGVLLFLPFAVGLALSFFAHRSGDWSFVGFANFADILGAGGYSIWEPLSFYFALVVTVLWTAVNLVLHVGIGLALALLLARPALKLKPLYRVLLILPWAVPNYITALIWKGMFHTQHGAINSFFDVLGIDRVSWFSSFWTAFFANVCANAWLGFPFMMVVCLGALQSVPKDLYEAASIDGASRWQAFRHVTVPLLWPALIPAMLIGTVWTFNQFNIVYLVSGGEPDNSTDILISEAYRWAFTRQEAYGYAAAYAALIFVILLGWSIVSARVARRAEAAR